MHERTRVLVKLGPEYDEIIIFTLVTVGVQDETETRGAYDRAKYGSHLAQTTLTFMSVRNRLVGEECFPCI